MATCNDCDPEVPHVIATSGAKRVRCMACGYKSHWRHGEFSIINDKPYLLDRSGHNGGIVLELDGEPWSDVLKDGQPIHLTWCCDAPSRSDLKYRKGR